MRSHISVHDIVVFVLEILALVFWGLIAWSQAQMAVWRWVLMIAAVAAFITLWGIFCSPHSRRRIPMPWLLVAKVPMLLLPGMIYLRGQALAMTVWAVAVLGHLAINAAQWEP